MIAVADSSPLIVLAKLDCLKLLDKLFPLIYISSEVHGEVVVTGHGLPGALEVERAEWIEVKSLQNHVNLLQAQEKYALGLGELSSIFLAKEIQASVLLLDDHRARKLAIMEGLQVRGSLGLLEALYMRGHLSDLRATFRLLQEHSYVDQRLLNSRLIALGLSPL